MSHDLLIGLDLSVRWQCKLNTHYQRQISIVLDQSLSDPSRDQIRSNQSIVSDHDRPRDLLIFAEHFCIIVVPQVSTISCVRNNGRISDSFNRSQDI